MSVSCELCLEVLYVLIIPIASIVYGKYCTSKGKYEISKFVEGDYKEYFSFKIAHQDKSWVSHSICKNCYAALSHWRSGTRKHLPFDIPMIWRESRLHEDCYFCVTKIDGFNSEN